MAEVKPERDTMSGRAQAEFSWYEFGYISAGMYRFAHPNPLDKAIGVPGDMQMLFLFGNNRAINGKRMNRFMQGWDLGLKHWDEDHLGK
jgi:hypothetical protein